MTEYDLETKKALRRVLLLEYGFGPETLRGRKICPACGRGNGAYRTDCMSCKRHCPMRPSMIFTAPATAAVQAVVWWSLMWRCTVRNVAPICRKRQNSRRSRYEYLPKTGPVPR